MQAHAADVSGMNPRRLAIAAIIAACAPMPAQASDFSVLLYFLYGLCAVAALVSGLLVRLIARTVASPVVRSLLWGAWCGLFLTPTSIAGGNGTLEGPPVLAFASLMLGGDPAYAKSASVIWLLSVPVWSVVIALIRRLSAHPTVPGDGPEH